MNKTINDFTYKAVSAIDDYMLIQETGGTAKRTLKNTFGNINIGSDNTYKIDMACTAGVANNFFRLGAITGISNGFTGLSDSSNVISYFMDGNLGIKTASTPVHQIDVVGTAGLSTGTTWTNTCDKRLKEDIEDADLDICYDNVKNLKLKYFKLKDEYFDKENHPDRHKVGWVADDVKEVFNKSVNVQKFGDIDDCKNLNIDSIISAMYGTIQKLIEKVETLESKIAQLEA